MAHGTWNRTIPAVVFACLVGLHLAACDDVNGPTPAPQTGPAVSALSFQPRQAAFQQLPPDQVLGDTLARIPLQLSAYVETSGGCVQRVGFIFAAGLQPRGPRVTGNLEPREDSSAACGSAWYETTALVELPRGATGPYTVRVYAVGDDGQLGDQMQGMFRYVLEQGKPPTVESVEASADTIRPPAELQFVATVSDPDGLSNIQRVFIGTPDGEEPLPMSDDGQTLGDAAADDGRYTASFDVDQAAPGEGVFRFWAVDRNGLASDTLEKTVVVAE